MAYGEALQLMMQQEAEKRRRREMAQAQLQQAGMQSAGAVQAGLQQFGQEVSDWQKREQQAQANAAALAHQQRLAQLKEAKFLQGEELARMKAVEFEQRQQDRMIDDIVGGMDDQQISAMMRDPPQLKKLIEEAGLSKGAARSLGARLRSASQTRAVLKAKQEKGAQDLANARLFGQKIRLDKAMKLSPGIATTVQQKVEGAAPDVEGPPTLGDLAASDADAMAVALAEALPDYSRVEREAIYQDGLTKLAERAAAEKKAMGVKPDKEAVPRMHFNRNFMLKLTDLHSAAAKVGPNGFKKFARLKALADSMDMPPTAAIAIMDQISVGGGALSAQLSGGVGNSVSIGPYQVDRANAVKLAKEMRQFTREEKAFFMQVNQFNRQYAKAVEQRLTDKDWEWWEKNIIDPFSGAGVFSDRANYFQNQALQAYSMDYADLREVNERSIPKSQRDFWAKIQSSPLVFDFEGAGATEAEMVPPVTGPDVSPSVKAISDLRAGTGAYSQARAEALMEGTGREVKETFVHNSPDVSQEPRILIIGKDISMGQPPPGGKYGYMVMQKGNRMIWVPNGDVGTMKKQGYRTRPWRVALEGQ